MSTLSPWPTSPPAEPSFVLARPDGSLTYVPAAALGYTPQASTPEPTPATPPATVPADAEVATAKAFTWIGSWTDGEGERYTSSASATATLTFEGTYLRLVGTKDAHHGEMSVTIDGGTSTVVSAKASTRQAGATLLETTALAEGKHTVTVASKSGTITVAFALVDVVVAPASTTPTPQGSSSPPPATTSPRGWVTRDPAKPQLLLDGKRYVFCGNNFVNAPYGATDDVRRITDQGDYYKRIAPGFVDRVWFCPGSPLAELETTVAAAKANGSRLVVALFDALGAKGPKWEAIKSGWGTWRAHVQTVVTRFKDEPTIIAWEIANEPPQDRAGFDLIGGFIKSLDPRHLVGTGTVPAWSDGDIGAYEKAGASVHVDILSIHSYDSIVPGLTPHAARHLPVARRLGKPIYWGEHGIDASPDGKGSAHTAPRNGLTSWAGRAKLLTQQVDAALGTPEVCGTAYWSIGKNRLGGDPGDSYMPFADTAGIGALQGLARQWNRS